jgi:hypothetical protein
MNLIMQFPPASCYFLPLSPRSPQHLVLDTLNLCFGHTHVLDTLNSCFGHTQLMFWTHSTYVLDTLNVCFGHTQLMFSLYYKQLSLTAITTAKYFNLHMFWQQTKRQNTGSKTQQIWQFKCSGTCYLYLFELHTMKMEATSSCATLVIFSNQQSATYQTI